MSGSVKLVPAVFHGVGAEGDFGWMLGQPHYSKALFVFNDNQQQFEAFHFGTQAGGGNAAVRPYQVGAPRAAGVATGPGYLKLDPATNQKVIDAGVKHIETLLATGAYDTLVYSADEDDPDMVGIKIFKVGDDVRRYIVAQLKRVAAG